MVSSTTRLCLKIDDYFLMKSHWTRLSSEHSSQPKLRCCLISSGQWYKVIHHYSNIYTQRILRHWHQRDACNLRRHLYLQKWIMALEKTSFNFCSEWLCSTCISVHLSQLAWWHTTKYSPNTFVPISSCTVWTSGYKHALVCVFTQAIVWQKPFLCPP